VKLTPRLQAIAELIPPGSVVADIGTDHAYLPVYLLLEQICDRAIASDMHEAPLLQAQETIAAFNCHQRIELRLGRGLEVLKEDDHVDTVVIAGLGGGTIASIIREGRELLQSVARIILQPMTEAEQLRLFLAANGFAIVHETLALEGRRLYEIIVARAGRETETDPFRLALGPRLLENRPPLFTMLLQEKIRKLRTVYRSLQRAEKKDVSAKLQEVKKQLDNLQEVLADAGKYPDGD